MGLYTPVIKQRSMTWCEPDESVPKKARMTRSARKIMATVFWDWKIILLFEYHPVGVSIAQDAYEHAESTVSHHSPQMIRGTQRGHCLSTR